MQSNGASTEPTGFDALALQIDAESPSDIVSSVQLLADFALKLSLGPVSRLWVPDVRRSVDALLLTGKHRNETALVALSTRLLEVLPKEALESNSDDVSETAVSATTISERAVSEMGGSENAVCTAVREARVLPRPGAEPVPDANVGGEASSDPSAALPSTRASYERDGALPEGTLLEGTLLEGTPLEGELRERILHEVSRLAGVLPEWPAPAQDLAEEARRRETHLMRELLAQVDGLKRDQRARLEEQMRLEDLSLMSPEAIAEEFGAPLERASELARVLESYRQVRQTRAPDLGNAIGLGLALDELEQRCLAFEDCDPEQKDALRVLRAERRQALSVVNLLLAERGELDWLEQLEPLAISERVGRVKQWLGAGSDRTY